MTIGRHTRLDTLINELESALQQCPTPEEQVRVVTGLLCDVLEGAPCVDDRRALGHPDHYARYRLYADPADRFCVVAMVWGGGQGTALHDHDGVWCVEGIQRGRVRITVFDLLEASGDRYRFRARSPHVSGVGEVGRLIPPSQYHKMENPFDDVAVSIHVYGHELRQVNRFVPADGGVHHLRETVRLGYDG